MNAEAAVCSSPTVPLQSCTLCLCHPQHPSPCARAASAIRSAGWCWVHNPLACTYICKQHAGHTRSTHGRHQMRHTGGRDIKLSTGSRMESQLPFTKPHPRFLWSVLRKKRDNGKSLVAWWDFWIALYLFPWYTSFQSLI